MQKQIEKVYKKENISEQINNLLEFGGQNGGWSNLLELEEVEDMVFQVEGSWQEVEPLMSERDVLERNDVVGAIKVINNSYEELKDLTDGIYGVLQDLKSSEELGNIKKADAGLVLRELQKMNDFNNLSKKTQEDISSLITLMEEFRNLYSKWMNSKNSFEQLIRVVEKIGQKKGGSGALSSRFPKNPGDLNKKTATDGHWGGRQRSFYSE